MEFLGHALEWFSVGAPLLGCILGWWFWIVARENVTIPSWRRTAGLLGLILVTVSIAFGGFAWVYWNRFPGSSPPDPTYVATLAGFALLVVAVPISLCAKSWTRAALIVCLVGLSGFYFLMFLSP